MIWLYTIFNGLIALAYFSIPLALLHYVKARKDLYFPWIFILFGLFILACGSSHILHILSLWQPNYRLQIVIDGITAVISIVTAFALWKQMPQILSIPSPAQLTDLNRNLNDEITLRIQTEQDLRKSQSRLEQRVNERTHQLNQANELLNESQKRLSTIIHHVHAVIWSMDENRQITFVSDYIRQLLGYSPSELYDHQSCLQKIHKRDHFKLIRAISKALTQQTPSHIKCRIRHLESGWRWACISIAPVKFKQEILQIVGFVHDAHQDYLQQKQVRVMNKQLDRRVKQAIAENLKQEKVIASQARFAAMGEMVANIAHQWRQPLNSLGLILEDIQDAYRHDELDGDYLSQSINKALQKIERMSSTIDLFQSRLGGKINKTYFPVVDVINDTVELIQDYLTSKGISLSVEARIQTYAYGSPDELSQVLQNLVANARDAILDNDRLDKKIHITLSAIAEQAVIEITDSGGGIAPAIKNKIFDPFFSSKNSGRGIGLYMVKQLVEQSLEGSITLENHDQGTKATITLPNRIV
ncbi:sensor histidine kinase [Methylomarinum vadi]|uniref:sensor histidine kinase n=1 Tax=Methylomarinum vadi TaxID=438855 RepID=UPI001F42FB53|nr:PAS domain-containing sensor histidine kinase [Methylomarinum vadi]